MEEIGGYFELELSMHNKRFIHSECVAVNSGRHALECILRNIPSKIKKVYVPYYTCDTVLQPINKLHIPFSFYHIDECLEIKDSMPINNNEFLIINNYFGIKDEYIKSLYNKYKDNLIVDNTQAWYASSENDVKAFYSPRKFFGVPDGGFACGNNIYIQDVQKDSSFDRSSHLLKRIDLGANLGYSDFKENSSKLTDLPIRKMSDLTFKLLQSINMEQIKIKRLENFKYLDTYLSKLNKMKLPSSSSFECPMIYPFMTEDGILKQKLIKNKIYVATYWPNVFDWCEKKSVEFNLASNLVPLPIDQRYGKREMDKILNIIMG